LVLNITGGAWFRMERCGPLHPGAGAARSTTIASLSSRDGEVDEEQLRLALLKALGDRWGGVLP
jgi:hypothetical protein